MKNILKIGAVVVSVVVVGGLIVGAVAFAQGPQSDGFSPQNFAGQQMRRGAQGIQGMMGGQMGNQMGGLMNEDMEETMHTAIADALGMSEADFETAMDSGKTMFDIAAEQGVDVNTVWDTMQSTRDDAMQQAVTAGTMTQEQADWMTQRGAGMMSGGAQSHGQMGGRMGGYGAQGGYGNFNGDCAFNNSTDSN